MKWCSRCKTNKDKKEFSDNSARYDGLNSFCQKCNREYQKEYYQHRRRFFINRNKKRKKEIKAFIKNCRIGTSCSKCGENDVRCLDFHHVKGRKKFSISNAHCRTTNKTVVLKEIAKCIVLCSNCHRKNT